MDKRAFVISLALAGLCRPDQACAQFTDPRTYENVPVGTNQIELGYAYARANASIDTSLSVTGAQIALHQGTIDYTRYFGWLDRLLWVEAGVPVASLGGSIAGTKIRGSLDGAGDSSYSLGMLLKGGPALSGARFEAYTPGTILGVSFTVTAPTGAYDPARILNLGADRWSLKPEIAVSCPFGPDRKWVFDGYANIYFFTDNTSYRGREILRQEPLPGLEGHISYAFNDRIWASLDTRYSFRATTFVNGVNQNNPQQNVVLGTETSVSLSPRNTLVIGFVKAVLHNNGPSVAGVSVKYDYTWGGQ